MHKSTLLSRRRHPLYLLTLLLYLQCSYSYAQNNRPYHLNGSASSESCNCYTLTTEQQSVSGSVWNINKIDLTQSFSYSFDVYLGCRDLDGADGIAFVLQPISTSIGTTGEGLGVEGVTPSVIVSIDTYQNNNLGDPSEDHIAININGDLNHNSSNNLAGPVSALADNVNIEDCQWHVFQIIWDADAKEITALIDGKERVSTNLDLVASVFNGDPKVYWGFSGATGGSINRQRFCTSLNAAFSFPPDQITCYPSPIQFLDSSTTFGAIQKWFWDFGDGTTDTVKNPPAHLYPRPGNYDVTLSILGNDGCLSDTFQQKVVAGSKPVAGFSFETGPYCDNQWIPFIDQSTVAYGTLHQWIWTIDGNAEFLGNAAFGKQFTTGNHSIELSVKTKEGCVSNPLARTLDILEHPSIDFTPAPDACRWEEITLLSGNINPSIPIHAWYWHFGDGKTGVSPSVQHAYTDTGSFSIRVYAQATNGCHSDTLGQSLKIYGTYANAGNDTIIAKGQPLQLSASGGSIYQWQPTLWLNNPSIPKPIASPQQDVAYILRASTSAGCASYDTIQVKVYNGPEFYIPNAFTPNGDGKNDLFRFTAVGITRINYFRVYNRFGNLVYQSPNPLKGWDGTFNGKAQGAGTYIWMIEGTDYMGNTLQKKGGVTLIR